MSRWIVLSKADLYNSKAAALIDAADSVSLGNGQADRSTGILADVTQEIRRRISKSNQLDANPAALPAGLKPLALDLVYCRLKSALELPLTEDERLFLQLREQQLDRLADGRDVVEPPDSPLPANPVEVVPPPSFGRGRPRLFTRESQDG